MVTKIPKGANPNFYAKKILEDGSILFCCKGVYFSLTLKQIREAFDMAEYLIGEVEGEDDDCDKCGHSHGKSVPCVTYEECLNMNNDCLIHNTVRRG